MWYWLMIPGIYICIYTASYGVFEWKCGNKSGAVSVWCLCVVVAVASVYKLFA